MIRDMIKFGDKRWKNFVHPENRTLVENAFTKKEAIV